MHDAVDRHMGSFREDGGDFVEGNHNPVVADLSLYVVMNVIEAFQTIDGVRDRNKEFTR